MKKIFLGAVIAVVLIFNGCNSNQPVQHKAKHSNSNLDQDLSNGNNDHSLGAGSYSQYAKESTERQQQEEKKEADEAQ